MAASALGMLRDARAVEPLITVLADPERMSVAAAYALGRLGDARALDPLIAALRDGSEDVREAAADALGNLGDPEAERAIADYRAAQQ